MTHHTISGTAIEMIIECLLRVLNITTGYMHLMENVRRMINSNYGSEYYSILTQSSQCQDLGCVLREKERKTFILLMSILDDWGNLFMEG